MSEIISNQPPNPIPCKTPKGSFYKAIEALLIAKLKHTIEPNKSSDLEEIDNAIRVLRAAGKVCRGAALMFMDDVDIPVGRVLDYKKAGRAIRALLESLPDKEET